MLFLFEAIKWRKKVYKPSRLRACYMGSIGKMAFLLKIFGTIFFVIIIVLLVFLIRNDWDIVTALTEFIDFISKLKEQISN